jgi:glycosyltransferase involved in cell wall biosynthesis
VLAATPDESVSKPSHAPVDRTRAVPSVSVIIPTLNEARNLPFVVNSVPEYVHEVIVVDGRSSDDTERVALKLGPPVRLVREAKKGKGAAINAGFRAATGDILVVMDADGSMNGQEIAGFVSALQAGADYAKGSRFCKGGASVDITRIRRIGDAGLCVISRILFGTRYTDATYGYKALWRDMLDLIDLDVDGFEVEMLIDLRAFRRGVQVAEVPCIEMLRIHGSSNLNALRDGWRCLLVILRERLRMTKEMREIQGVPVARLREFVSR